MSVNRTSKRSKNTKTAKFCKKVLQFYFLCLYLQSQMKGKPIIGVWRSWLAHLVWDQRVLCSSHSTPTSEEQLSLIVALFLFNFGRVINEFGSKERIDSEYDTGKRNREVFRRSQSTEGMRVQRSKV